MTQPELHWTEGEAPDQTHHAARWRSESGATPPKRVVLADDRTTADVAYRLACEGVGLLWRGDFQNARQLLQAITRRVDKRPRKPVESMLEAFNQHRQIQSQRARILGMLLIPFDAGHGISLRRAPDARQACEEAHGPANEPYVASLRELLGLIGAFEWRKKGVEIPALDNRIHPHYGVFSPLRGEYIDLVARTPMPRGSVAFDIGTGTGVLAAVLARRGGKRVIATDMDPRALACARENLQRLGLAQQVEVVEADLFPEGRVSLAVCNPPWLPARPSSPVEHAVYDPDSRMLRGFLNGLPAHLTPNGEGWLILSDLAEHLGLRTREQLLEMIEQAGLRVLERIDTRPTHGRARDAEDPLYAARSKEVTSLWRLAAAA